MGYGLGDCNAAVTPTGTGGTNDSGGKTFTWPEGKAQGKVLVQYSPASQVANTYLYVLFNGDTINVANGTYEVCLKKDSWVIAPEGIRVKSVTVLFRVC